MVQGDERRDHARGGVIAPSEDGELRAAGLEWLRADDAWQRADTPENWMRLELAQERLAAAVCAMEQGEPMVREAG